MFYERSAYDNYHYYWWKVIYHVCSWKDSGLAAVVCSMGQMLPQREGQMSLASEEFLASCRSLVDCEYLGHLMKNKIDISLWEITIDRYSYSYELRRAVPVGWHYIATKKTIWSVKVSNAYCIAFESSIDQASLCMIACIGGLLKQRKYTCLSLIYINKYIIMILV